MACCAITFLLIIVMIAAFLIGVYVSDHYNLNGVEDLWRRISDSFKKETSFSASAPKFN